MLSKRPFFSIGKKEGGLSVPPLFFQNLVGGEGEVDRNSADMSLSFLVSGWFFLTNFKNVQNHPNFFSQKMPWVVWFNFLGSVWSICLFWWDYLVFTVTVLNFVEKNRDSKILGGKVPPRKNILTASIFCQKSNFFFPKTL